MPYVTKLVYHLTAHTPTDDYRTVVLGVAADSAAEARQLAAGRLTGDGCAQPITFDRRAEPIIGAGWEHGTVLVYTATDGAS